MLGDIIANLAAAAIGGIVVFSWERLIYPLFVQAFREPTKLASEYAGLLDFGRGPHHKISIRLNKRGYRITGTLRFTEGRHQGKEYALAGRYWHGLLTFTYWPLDQSSTSQGTATFQRLRDGTVLRGQFAYYSQDADQVSSVLCELRPA